MTTIKLKNGSGAPTAGDLVVAEPALDLTNKRLYTEDSGGTVIEVGTNPTSVTTGDITATGTATFAGLTTTADVSFGDNDKAIFGAGSDLQIYHDSTTNDSIITESGAGNLVLQGDSLRLTNTSGVRYLQGNSGAEVNLWHNGSKKLATTSTGIDVTGTAVVDGLTSSAAITSTSNSNSLGGTTFTSAISGTTASMSGSITVSGNSNTIGGTTFSSAIDVTGTVTADGLTVDGTTSFTQKVVFDNNDELRWKDSGGTERTVLVLNGSNDLNLGTSAGGNLKFYNGSSYTERMRIDSSGNVGIGTSSPANPLEVAGGSSYPTTKFSRDGGTAATQGYLTTGFSAIGYSGGTGADTYMVSEHGFGFAVNAGTTAMTITDGGNVGIGTSSPTADGLHIFNASQPDLFMGTTADPDGFGITYNDTDTSIGNSSNTPLRFRTNNTEAMRIDSSGNVGIGTSSPSSVLHAKGGSTTTPATASDFLTNATARLVVNHGNEYGAYIGYVNSSNDAIAIQSARSNGTTGPLSLNTFGGNVGIGTSTPAYGLVVSNSGASGIEFGPAYSGTANLVQHYNRSGSAYVDVVNDAAQHRFNISGTEKVRIDSSGNLLVGQTSADSNSVGIGLLANGTAYAVRDGSAAILAHRKSSDGNIMEFLKDNSTVGSIGNNTDFYIASQDGTGVRFTSTQVLPCSESGAIQNGSRELGSTSARFKNLYLSNQIDVTGSTTYAGYFSTSYDYVAKFESTDSAAFIVLEDNASTADGNRIGVTGDNMEFETAGSEAMRIDASGNLLVGTTSTTIDTSSNASGLLYKPGNFLCVATTLSGNSNVILNKTNSQAGVVVDIRYNGSVVGTISNTSSATSYNTSSDQRLKENIVDAPSASDDIDAIQVRSFDWKADGSHQKYGMVAQELQSVAPEAVTGDADSDDMMGVDYSKLVPMMLKEIQSLRARVAQLEGEN